MITVFEMASGEAEIAEIQLAPVLESSHRPAQAELQLRLLSVDEARAAEKEAGRIPH